jgi:ABC-type branched-subunit amino acid transport system ATPase component
MTITTPIIAVEGAIKRFRETAAADHVSFAVERAEIFGPDGAGKTTIMACSVRPDAGTNNDRWNRRRGSLRFRLKVTRAGPHRTLRVVMAIVSDSIYPFTVGGEGIFQCSQL